MITLSKSFEVISYPLDDIESFVCRNMFLFVKLFNLDTQNDFVHIVLWWV